MNEINEVEEQRHQEQLEKILEFQQWFESNRDYEVFADVVMHMALSHGLIMMEDNSNNYYKWKTDFEGKKVYVKVGTAGKKR